MDVEKEIKLFSLKTEQQEVQIAKLRNALFTLRTKFIETQREYVELYDNSIAALITIDLRFIIRNINFQASELMGIEREQLINRLFLNYLSDDSKDILKDAVNNLCENNFNQRCEVELQLHDTEFEPVIIEFTLIDRNRCIRLRLSEPLSSRHLKIQNNQLEKSIHFIHTLFQEANEPIAALDNELNITIVNDSFSSLFYKLIPQTLSSGINFAHFLQHEPILKNKFINACIEAMDNKKAQLVIESAEKEIENYYCYKFHIHTMPHQDPQKKELIICVHDVSLEKLEELLTHQRQSQIALSCRSSAMKEMVSALAHEINQPLTSIIAYGQSCLHLVNNPSTPASLLLEPLKKIIQQTELTGEIIHNMEAFMLEGTIELESTDINQLIKETLSILQYELLNFNLNIDLKLMNNLPVILTNKVHLMQVILNLARNSIEALKKASVENPELIIETSRSSTHIIVHMRDNGPGIPSSFHDKVLNAYFTTKRKGTGIGLGICRTLIEQHQGQLSVQQPEKGAWFTFTLAINENNSF